ncbi:uncharacterized protein LOC143446536 isoform X2 [Clavelina lepadiformis]|uniref:uncharacterized protein LOC143446536 isoform X2 n=1 Tax=Clavelina lepadiformis TaxID=159417 RepID=UPI0040424FFC
MRNAVYPLLWVFICSLLRIGQSKLDDDPKSWYLGCYLPRRNSENQLHPYRNKVLVNPARCSKNCLDQGHNYAALSDGSLCSCLTDQRFMVRAKSDDCTLRCPNDLQSPCGGIQFYSIYSIKGPFISSVQVLSAPKAVIGENTNIEIRIRLASKPDFPTGLKYYENTTFDRVNVVVAAENGATYRKSINIIDTQGQLIATHVYSRLGFYTVDVRVRNDLSYEAMRQYITVISPIPRGLLVQDGSVHSVHPSCTPKFISESSSYRLEEIDSTSVVRSEIVILRATLSQGVNITFDWNFCNLARRTATPHLDKDQCAASVCHTNEQSFEFRKDGLCEVTVTASNNLGSTTKSIFVAIISPEIKDVTVSISDCEEECSRANLFSQEGPSLPTGFELPSSRHFGLFPPGVGTNIEVQSTTLPPTSTPPGVSPSPKLPDGMYEVNTKVCFHATAYVSVRASVKTHIRFGDGETVEQDLSERGMWGHNLFRRSASGPYDPYEPSHYSGRDSGFLPLSNFGMGLERVWTCYLNGCVLNMYFSHVYETPGKFLVDVQISNDTFQTASRLVEPITIVPKGHRSLRKKLKCEEVVRAGRQTQISVPKKRGRNFAWNIARFQDNGVDPSNSTSIKWLSIETVIHKSPLRYVFNNGTFRIQVNDTTDEFPILTYCIVRAENVIRDVVFSLRPGVRYVTVGDAIHADLKVNKGSNFSITWIFENKTLTNDQRFDAVYSISQKFTPSMVGCQNLSVVIENSVSRIETTSERPVCSEEKITGLSLMAPDYLEVGQSANLSASIESGSHVEISVQVACYEGAHLMSFTHTTGAKMGPSEFNFRTTPFPEPGYFRVVFRAKNHVTVGRARGVRLVMRKNIKVGRVIQNVTIRVISEENETAYSNEDNTFLAVVNGKPDKTSGILYKWTFPNVTSELKTSVLYTASPIVRIKPICNATLGGDVKDCMISLTARSGVSKATAQFNVTSFLHQDARIRPSIRHRLITPLGEDFEVDIDCFTSDRSHTSCRVVFSDDKSFVRFSANSTSTLGHVFSYSGLFEIRKHVVTSLGPILTKISFISVQQKPKMVKIKGDQLLILDENPTGNWRAITTEGSYLVFQWQIRRQNMSQFIVSSTRVTCVREFAFHFNQSGIYEVIVNVFNDVSRMQVSTLVEVRHAATHIEIEASPVYLGDNSKFVMTANVSRPFTLTVKWSEKEEMESYTQDQLRVMDHPDGLENFKLYLLTHLYPIAGRHRFVFILEWLASEDDIIREISGYANVYDMNVAPPVALTLKVNDNPEPMTSPYNVFVNDLVKVQAKINELVVLLDWNVTNNRDVTFTSLGHSLAPTAGVIEFEFVAVSPGLYTCNVTSQPGSLGAIVKVAAVSPITALVLDRPYLESRSSFVDFCELKPSTGHDAMCDPLVFSARSNGDDVTFRFEFRRINGNLDEDHVTIVTANTTTSSVSNVGLSQEARLEFTFQVEGDYNVSVIAMGKNHHNNKLNEAAALTVSLDFLFYAGTPPLVSLPKKNFLAESGNVTSFQLKQKKVGQEMKVYWDMGDGTRYNDSGLSMSHIFSQGGDYVMHIIAYNRIGKSHLKPVVQVEDRLKSIEITSPAEGKIFRTNSYMLFTAKTQPKQPHGRIEFLWFFENNNQPKTTYQPAAQHVFPQAGSHLVKVEVKNRINQVESIPIELTLARPIPPFQIYAPRDVQIGSIFQVETFNLGHDIQIEWNMGDGTLLHDKYSVTHSYMRVGIYTISLTLENTFGFVTETHEIFATEDHCSVSDVEIGGRSGKKQYRSKPIRLEAVVKFNCSSVVRVDYHWTIAPALNDLPGPPPASISRTGQVLDFAPDDLPYGRFEVSVNVSFIGTILHRASLPHHIEIIPSPLVAQIKGGTLQKVSKHSDVTIDASQSFDPDLPEDDRLKFNWECVVFDAPDKACFKNHTILPTPATPSSSLRVLPQSRDRTKDDIVSSFFPCYIVANRSVLSFPARILIEDHDTFIFKVNVSKEDRPQSSSEASAVVVIASENTTASVSIDCPLCQKLSMIRHQGMLFSADCNSCRDKNVTYSWSIDVVDDGKKSFYKNESSDCAPPDGTGWQSWKINLTLSFLNNFMSPNNHTEDLDSDFQDPYEQHDNISDYNSLDLYYPSYSQDPFVHFFNLRNTNQTEEDAEYTSFQEEEGLEAKERPEGEGKRSKEENDLGWGFPDIAEIGPDLESNTPEDFSPTSSHGSNLRDSSNNLLSEAEIDPSSRRFGGFAPGRIGYGPPLGRWPNNPYGSPGTQGGSNGYRTGLVGGSLPSNPPGLMSEGEIEESRLQNRNWTSSQLYPSQIPIMEGDDFIDGNAIPASTPQTDNHYQNLRHQAVPLDRVAVAGANGQILWIKPNSLEEGKTYAISVDVTDISDQHKIRGSRTYYTRVDRGPSYGDCSVIQEMRNDTFRVDCLGWKNRQDEKTDTDVSQNEILTYDVSYSLSEQAKKRMIYRGSLHKRNFQLPAIVNPVFIHVELQNSDGARTRVCRFPVNVTRPGRPSDQTDVADFDFVYTCSVGIRSKLHHLILLKDQNSILAEVNMLVDSMPHIKPLTELVKRNLINETQLSESVGAIVRALSTIKFGKYVRFYDVTDALSRAVAYAEYLAPQDIVTVAEIIINGLQESTKEEKATPSGPWAQLARGLKNVHLSGQFLDETLSSISRLTFSLRKLLRKSHHPGPSLTEAVRAVLRIEDQLRDFYIKSVVARLPVFGKSNVTSAGINMVAQSAQETLILNQSGSLLVGAKFAPEFFSSEERGQYLQAGIAYLDESPYLASGAAQRMDDSALSVWLLDDDLKEVRTRDLKQPIKIYLPPRKEVIEEVKAFRYQVKREQMSVHEFDLSEAINSTLHVEISIEDKQIRHFTIAVAFSQRRLSSKDPLNDTSIIALKNFSSIKRHPSQSKEFTNFIKTSFKPHQYVQSGKIYVTLWSTDVITASQRRRYRDQKVTYNLSVWMSDCFYWDKNEETWSVEGVQILGESTLQQTVCSTTHLSTFTSSYHQVKAEHMVENTNTTGTSNALSPCLAVLFCTLAFFTIFLTVHRFVLRHRDFDDVRDDVYKSPRVGGWVRWWLGTDDGDTGARIPILLRDNKTEHSQVFEITVQTGNWPGSGTTSLPHIVIYGQDGKYEARELVSPTGLEMAHESSKAAKNERNGSCFFETGSTKTFIASFEQNLGPIWKLCIWHDHSGFWPRWYLDYVIIRDVNSDERWYFPCYAWLALDRGGRRISRELEPLERKPTLARHLAIKTRNNLLDCHSVLPIFACACWGALTRSQRIVHAMTLCFVILGLTTAKIWLVYASDFENSFTYFSAEAVFWGFLIGLTASAILLPVQLILRFTKRDERVSVAIEDTTSGGVRSPNSLSHVSTVFKSGDDLYAHESNKCVPGGLRKTETIAQTDLLGLDHEGDFDVVTVWLKGEHGEEKVCQGNPSHPFEPEESICSWPPRHSVSSLDEEIVRCMRTSSPSTFVTHEPTDRTIPDSSCYGDCSSSCCHANDFNESVSNISHSRHPSDETIHVTMRKSDVSHYYQEDDVIKPRILAMDGPILVPCEKLAPLPQTWSGLLPPECVHVGWVYYVTASIIACAVVIYGAANVMEDIDVGIWLETVFFALFWTLLVIEVLVIFMSSFVSTCVSLFMDTELSEVLPNLFPSVEVAAVDDYSYKYFSDSSEKYEINDGKTATLDPSVIKLRICERRRSRYLRNVAPPYNQKGRWKSKKDPLRLRSREMRSESAAMRAISSWLIVIFLSVMLVTFVFTQRTLKPTKQINHWFNLGFCVNENSVVYQRMDSDFNSNFSKVTSLLSWQEWFEKSFHICELESRLNQNYSLVNLNQVLLGPVTVTALRRTEVGHCSELPSKMRKLLYAKNYCKRKPANSTDSEPKLFYGTHATGYVFEQTVNIHLHQRNKQHYTEICPANSSDAVSVDIVLYDLASRRYFLISALSEFRTLRPQSTVTIRSASLQTFDTRVRDWLAFCHVVVLIWAAWWAFKNLLSLIEFKVLGKGGRMELSRRSLHRGSKMAALLDLTIWMSVVAYLVSSCVMRYSAFVLSYELENSNHFHQDPGSLIRFFLKCEEATRYTLGIWTTLFVIKVVNLAVNLHGYKSKLTYSVTAVCQSSAATFKAVLFPFTVLVLIMSMFGQILFGTGLVSHSSLAGAMQKTMQSSAWLGLVGGHAEQDLKAYRSHTGLLLAFLYFSVLFFTTRLILKGFIVASHRWFHANGRTAKASKQSGKCSKTVRSGKKTKKQSLKSSSKAVKRTRVTEESWISFMEIWTLISRKIKNFFGIMTASLFCGSVPICLDRFCPARQSYDDHRRGSAQSLSRLKSLSFSSYDKSKMPNESGCSTCDLTPTKNCFSLPKKTPQFDVRWVGPMEPAIDEYNLSGDVALSEHLSFCYLPQIELQVNEFCVRATALVDDVMSTFSSLEKHHKKDCGKSVKEALVSRTDLCVPGRASDQDHTNRNLCSVTVTPYSGRGTLQPQNVDNQSLRQLRAIENDQIIQVKPARAVHPRLKASLSLPIDPNERDSVRLSGLRKISANSPRDSGKTTGRFKKVSPFPQKDPNPVDVTISTDDAHTPLPTLTTLNIARHNHRLHRTKSDVQRTSSGEVPSTSSNDVPCTSAGLRHQQVVADESSSSSGTGSRTSGEGNESGENFSACLWRAIQSRKRKAKKKNVTGPAPTRPRGLRRSQTVFIDVRELPVIPSFQPALPSQTHSNKARSHLKDAISSKTKEPPRFAAAFETKHYKSSVSDRAPLGGKKSSTPVTAISEEDFEDEIGSIPGYVPG